MSNPSKLKLFDVTLTYNIQSFKAFFTSLILSTWCFMPVVFLLDNVTMDIFFFPFSIFSLLPFITFSLLSICYLSKGEIIIIVYICRILQNWSYLMSHWPIIFSPRGSQLILKISLISKKKMYNLLITIYISDRRYQFDRQKRKLAIVI
jgi:hypothetical protein